MLTVFLLGFPFGAVLVVLLRGLRGEAAVLPFTLAGLLAFATTGVLLITALITGPEVGIRALFYGTASFGSAVLCGLSAIAVGRSAAKANRDQEHDGP